MLKYFQCPDMKQVTVQQCLANCRMMKRCAPLPYLKACADQREWTGKPSVTQLIKGTREAYLTIREDYTIIPDQEVFALFGTGIHKAMEAYTPEHLREIDTELTFDGGETVTGTADLLEEVGDNMYRLVDYKTSGAFKVKKALGLKKRTEKLVNGESRIVVEYVPEDVDMGDWVYQLNMYRIMLERQMPDISIPEMFIFAMVRDGGLQATRNYGIEENTYLIPVQIKDDNQILDYFRYKATELIRHLDAGVVPPHCSQEECWHGRKCARYCKVYQFCGGI